MLKRNSDGDVIGNRVALANAKLQKLLASTSGLGSYSSTTNNDAVLEDADEVLTEEHFPDRLGVGGVAPKDAEKNTIRTANHTSNDKLLEQLVGNKRANALRAGQREVDKPETKPRPKGKSHATKHEESEEEEDRPSMLKSKRKKTKINESEYTRGVEINDDNPEVRHGSATEDQRHANGKSNQGVQAAHANANQQEGKVLSPANEETSQRTKVKPKSFLDEILAERSKKKGKRKQT